MHKRKIKFQTVEYGTFLIYNTVKNITMKKKKKLTFLFLIFFLGKFGYQIN